MAKKKKRKSTKRKPTGRQPFSPYDIAKCSAVISAMALSMSADEFDRVMLSAMATAGDPAAIRFYSERMVDRHEATSFDELHASIIDHPLCRSEIRLGEKTPIPR